MGVIQYRRTSTVCNVTLELQDLRGIVSKTYSRTAYRSCKHRSDESQRRKANMVSRVVLFASLITLCTAFKISPPRISGLPVSSRGELS